MSQTTGTPHVCVLLPVLVAYSALLPTHARSESATLNCGVLSLRTLAALCGVPLSPASEARLRGRIGDSEISLQELQHLANDIGVATQGWRIPLKELLNRQTPTIVHFRSGGSGHFGVIIDYRDGVIRWLDSGVALRLTPVEEFQSAYTGNCLMPMPRGSEGNRPPLAFTQLHSDLGVVEEPEVSCTFEGRNVGNETLRFAVLPCTDCGVSVDKAVLEPGETAQVVVTGPVHPYGSHHAVKVVVGTPAP